MTHRDRIDKISTFLKKDIWKVRMDELSPYKVFLIRQLRILLVALRGLMEDNIYLRASALTFFSLLAIVPFFAMAFGIATGFGLEQYLEDQLAQAFVGRNEVLEYILEITGSFLETAQGGVLASVGLAILFYSVMKVLNHIEESFNEIWQITRERSFSRKFADYFSIMLLAPFFIILSNVVTVFMTTQLQELALQIWIFGPLAKAVLIITPYLLIWVMLMILYMVMPNTRVKLSSALIAGIIAGTIFQFVQWGYIYFQIGVSKYSAIYGSFAALPLLLMWMQISWLIVLFGAELSFAFQNVEQYEYENESLNISSYNRRLITLFIARVIVKNFENGEQPFTARQISNKFQIPIRLVKDILKDLTDINMLSETRNFAKDIAYQPAIDINRITVKYLSDKLDHHGMTVPIAGNSPEMGKIKDIMESFNQAIEKNPENKLLKDI